MNEKPKLVNPVPNARYDDVYHEGVAWLNENDPTPESVSAMTDAELGMALQLQSITVEPHTSLLMREAAKRMFAELVSDRVQAI